MISSFPGIYVHIAKMLCLLAGIVLAVYLRHARQHSLKELEKKLNVGLGIIALISILAFYNFTAFHNGRIFRAHELFQYYMGSKYFEETGYLYLYDAAIQADEEEGGEFFRDVKTIFDQATYRTIPRSMVQAPARINGWRPNFSPGRWKEFKRDLEWFEGRYSEAYPESKSRTKLVSDFGYNASPVWMLAGHPLSNVIPTSSHWGMLLLSWLDGVLALVMFGVLYWAFGFGATALAVIFWGSTFMYVYEYTGGMLHHDWIAYAVIAVCLLKKELPWPAGFFFAYSVGLQLFPALFALPVVAVLAICFIEKRQRKPAVSLSHAERVVGQFLLAATLSLALLIAFTAFFGPGNWGGWPGFLDIMRMHADRSAIPWGLGDIFFWRGETDAAHSMPAHWQEAKYADYYYRLWPLVGCVKLAMLALLVRVCLRLEYWEMLCLGSSVPFVLLLLSKYYYADLVILIPLLCVRWEQEWRIRALTLLFSCMIALHMLDVEFSNVNYLFTAFFFAVFLTVFYLYCFFAPIDEEQRARITRS